MEGRGRRRRRRRNKNNKEKETKQKESHLAPGLEQLASLSVDACSLEKEAGDVNSLGRGVVDVVFTEPEQVLRHNNAIIDVCPLLQNYLVTKFWQMTESRAQPLWARVTS